MKKIFLMLLLIAAGFMGKAQPGKETRPNIAIVARSYTGHIVLRYFAATPSLFNRAINAGYVIEKAVFKTGVPFEKLSFTPIKGSPFKRWNEMQWESAFKEADKKDSNNIRLAGFAYSLSDTHAMAGKTDVLEGGLKSLKEERDNTDMKFAFALIAANQSKMAAEGLALRVNDNNVVPGTTYVYRIRVNIAVENEKAETGYIKIKCEDFNDKYLINNKAVKIKEGDKEISFSFPESKEYYAFNVERSDDGGATYKKITGAPALKVKPQGFTGKSDYSYGDSGLVNYKKYYYRVLVATPFADDLLLSEFAATPRDLTAPPSPFLRSATHIKPGQVELIWEMDKVNTDDLKGFKIRRSDEIKGKYAVISNNILSKTSTKYIDESFNRNGANYYMVDAIDTAGNTSQSFPAYVTLIDSTPPAPPIVSLAVIDSLGKITIKVKPNTERDFMGYELQKANSKEHEFSIIQQTFKDSLGNKVFVLYDSTTLNTLTKKIYYKLIAFDYHFNQSAPSQIVELTRRDTIAPAPGILTHFFVTDSSVVLSFANSSSEDAANNFLLRRETGKAKYDTIFYNSNTGITKFEDKKIDGGKEYEFAMIAKDDGGLLSKISRSLVIKTIPRDKLPTPVLKGRYDEKTKTVQLTFEMEEKPAGKKIKIEISRRENKTNVWSVYKILELDKNKTFTDDQVKGKKGMIYIVRLLAEDNKTSNYSKQLELNF